MEQEESLIEDILNSKWGDQDINIIQKYDLDNLDLRIQNNKGQTALIAACKKERRILVKSLLEADEKKGYSSVGLFDNDRNTALLEACYKKDESTIEKLLRTGNSNPGHPDKEGKTALIVIIESYSQTMDKKKLINLLIDTKKSEPGHPDKEGKTALMYAIIEKDMEIAEKLINTKESNPGKVDDEKNTALKYAITQFSDEKLVERLIDTEESNPGHPDKEGRTALMYAIQNRDWNIAKKLIKTGKSETGHVGGEGKTALIYAIFENNTEIVNELIKTGKSNQGHVDKEGNTALLYACKPREINPDIISLLIHPNGKPECINKKGEGALSILYDDYEYYKNEGSDKQKIIFFVLVKLIHYFYSKYFTKKKITQYIHGSTVFDINTVKESPVTDIERIQVHYQLLQKICLEQKDNKELKEELESKGVKFESFCAIPTEDIKVNLPVGTRVKSNSDLNKPDDADEIITGDYPVDVVNHHVKDIKRKIEKGEIVLEKDPNKPGIQTVEDYLNKLEGVEVLTDEEVNRIHRGVHGDVDMTPHGVVGLRIPKRTNLRIGGKKNRKTARKKKTVHPRRKTTRRRKMVR